MTPAEQYHWLCRMIDRKSDTYSIPQQPAPDPKDFIVWGEGEFEGVYQKEYPVVRLERLPDEGLL